MNVKLFDSEQKVMEVLWREGNLHAGQIAEILKEEIGWNRNTTYTCLLYTSRIPAIISE